MNITTRRFPRTLAEAFPDSLEASIAKAEYGAAVKIYRNESVPTHAWLPMMCVCFAIGVLTGVLLCQ